MKNPIFTNWCSFCGSTSHTRRGLDGTPRCHEFQRFLVNIATMTEEGKPLPQLCEYPECPHPSQHHIQVCPTLHRRCHVCEYRGHDNDYTDCFNMNNTSYLDETYQKFAPKGRLTRRLTTRKTTGPSSWDCIPDDRLKERRKRPRTIRKQNQQMKKARVNSRTDPSTLSPPVPLDSPSSPSLPSKSRSPSPSNFPSSYSQSLGLPPTLFPASSSTTTPPARSSPPEPSASLPVQAIQKVAAF